jgi:hypothetical protein
MHEQQATRSVISPVLFGIFPAASGLADVNIYYSQPLSGVIAPTLGLRPGLTGLIVLLAKLGYGAGLLLLAPLSVVFENIIVDPSNSLETGARVRALQWKSNSPPPPAPRPARPTSTGGTQS